MSCYILDIKKYEQIKTDWNYWYEKILGRLDYEPTLFEDMYAWNQRAFNERYRENNPIEPLPELNPVIPACPIRLYKNLQCLEYQCSDSSQWENSSTYNEVKRMSGLVAHRIISGLPEYDQLPW